tara:strand:- start:370 stop:891 length:522 start_codon:yes stop_codon:yes gene_type:complete
MFSKIIWFTGLSGGGKSTLSNSLKIFLKKKRYKVLQVDGDTFRKLKKYKNNFTKKTIKKNNIKIIKFVKSKMNNYDFILVSVISPLRITRQFAKFCFKDKYFEIYVFCSLKILKKRDTKGLYAKADEKKIKNLIGYKSKISYERSTYKVISINTGKMNLIKSRDKILKKINFK